MGGVGVDFVGLTDSTTSNEFVDKGGHSWPPIILLEEVNCVEVSTVGPGKGFMDVLNEGVAGGFRNIEVAPVIESAMVEVPVLGVGVGKRNGGGFHGREDVNDKLVERGGFSNFGGQGGVQHINVKVGEKNLLGVIEGGVHVILVGEGVGRTHSNAGGVVPDQVVVLEEHLPSHLAVRQTLRFLKVG